MNNRFCNFFRAFCPRGEVGNDDLRQPFLNRVAINGPAIPEEKFPVQIRVKPLPKEPLRLQQKRKNLQIIENALKTLNNPTNCNTVLPISLLILLGIPIGGFVFLAYISGYYASLGKHASDNYDINLIPNLNKTCFTLDSFFQEWGGYCPDEKTSTLPPMCIDALNAMCKADGWTLIGALGGSVLGIIDLFLVIGTFCLLARRCEKTFLPEDLVGSQFRDFKAAEKATGLSIGSKEFREVIEIFENIKEKLQRSIENDIYYRRIDFVGGIYRDPESKIAVSEDELQLLSPEIVREIFAFAKLNEPNELQAIRVDDLEPEDEEKHSAAAPGMGM